MKTTKTPTPATEASVWHALPAERVLAALDSRPEGLSEEEARRRLDRYGPNRLRPPYRRRPLLRLLLQFHNVLIYVLLGAATVTAALGHWVDAGVILGVVVINALIGFVQEGKAEKALNAIRGMLSLHARVYRNGHRQDVSAEQLTPGDIVLLASGDKAPADLRLLEICNLRVEEAALTGESEPVEKTTAPVAETAAIGDRLCLVYSGSLVTYGQGLGVVTATGDHTEIGRISRLLEEVQELTTPLLRQMTRFGRWLTLAILGLAGGTFALGILLRGYSAADMLLAAVGLAVAAIPEGLPAIMTITLAIGVQRMARRHAIIRRLPAVETLGSVTVIRSDKTGTLTKNEMTVQRVIVADCMFEASGAGYDPDGEFSRAGVPAPAADCPELLEIARAGLLCNEARLRREDERWVIKGDPTEGALLTLAAKAGLDAALEHDLLPRTDTILFESEHRFMATLHHDHAGHSFIYLKGASERALSLCHWERWRGEDRPLERNVWHGRIEQAATAGLRPCLRWWSWKKVCGDGGGLAQPASPGPPRAWTSRRPEPAMG